MRELDKTREELASGIQLEAGASYRIRLVATAPAVSATIVEFPDILFNHDSAVPCLDGDENLLRGLSHAYFHARSEPDDEMLVLGHTDTSGEPEVNYPLSELRAMAVLALLTDNEEAWKTVTNERSKVEDYQRIFKSFSTLYYWDCDPGGVDNKDGPRTRRGVEGFQHEVNSVFDLGIVTDGLMGPETWNAIFKVFRGLVDAFGIDLQLDFRLGNRGTGIYACGESFPIDQAQNNDWVSQENRRVELYFAKPGQIQPLKPPAAQNTNLTKEECVLFDSEKCERLVFGGRSALTLERTDLIGEPVTGAIAHLLDGSGNEVRPPEVTDDRGFVFWVDLDEGEFEVIFD